MEIFYRVSEEVGDLVRFVYVFNFFRIILSILMSMYFGFENWVALKEFGYRSWTLSIGFIMDRDLFFPVLYSCLGIDWGLIFVLKGMVQFRYI